MSHKRTGSGAYPSLLASPTTSARQDDRKPPSPLSHCMCVGTQQCSCAVRTSLRRCSQSVYLEAASDVGLSRLPGPARRWTLPGAAQRLSPKPGPGRDIALNDLLPVGPQRSASPKSCISHRSGFSRYSLDLHGSPCGLALLFIARPAFVSVQILLSLSLWFLFMQPGGGTFGGLEVMWPGRTAVRLHDGCEDLRFQPWRWFAYQFTHASFMHVALNCTMLLIAIPQERFQGSLRLALFFNAGILGAGLSHSVVNAHAWLVGQSGGCYAVFGVYIADLVLNFDNRRLLKCDIALVFSMLLLAILEVCLSDAENISHAAHAGGFLSGILVCCASGRIVHEGKWKLVVRITATVSFFVFLASAVLRLWIHWPPKSISEGSGWCWMAQVWNRTLFPDSRWHCVRCEDTACVARLIAVQRQLRNVSEAACAG
eukprot:TRINITY_DN17637_c0_g1_i1.p1 TRINITY_DN17637_c0_g1~~TRINITY_DN17637_c0_g1_i1.p1  ORF type:complete len:428 (+),score=29.81 TRINITY_DN17637_c0_g1_i1:70-1353(+)